MVMWTVWKYIWTMRADMHSHYILCSCLLLWVRKSKSLTIIIYECDYQKNKKKSKKETSSSYGYVILELFWIKTWSKTITIIVINHTQRRPPNLTSLQNRATIASPPFIVNCHIPTYSYIIYTCNNANEIWIQKDIQWINKILLFLSFLIVQRYSLIFIAYFPEKR